MIYRSTNKSKVTEAYTQEIQEVFNITLLDTLVTPVGMPLSGISSENTCIRTFLGIIKPFVDQPIRFLIVLVPPRTTLRKILSST
jgi:hypothetical protein